MLFAPPTLRKAVFESRNSVTDPENQSCTLGASHGFQWGSTGILNKNHTKWPASFLNHQKVVGFFPEVFLLLTSLQNKAKKQLNQSKQAKNTLIQWLRFQKAHCEPEKQFCIKFVSNNTIKGILLVQKRLSILMYHELFLNSAYKTCLVGKTCHLLSSSKSITAANKECLYFSRPKRFLCKFLESRWSAA